MKRLLLSCCILLCVVSAMQAQEQPLISPDDSIRSLVGRLFPNSNPDISAHMNLQFSTSGVANFVEGDLEDASFKLNRVKLEILGSFSKQFSYHFRQSFNKYSNPHSLDNLSSSIEYALVNWKMSDKFTLNVGKQDIALGGYEYYVNAIKVREYSEFNDNISCYQAGVAGRFNLSPANELVLQVVNNRSGENDETYLYGLPQGVEKAKVPVLSAPSTAQHAEYFTTVVNFDYRIHPNWNLYLKGAYERAGIYKTNGHFEKGLYRTTWNAQACVEYFPMRNSELLLFAHFLYKGHHLARRAQALGGMSPDTQRVSIGLVYSIPVF